MTRRVAYRVIADATERGFDQAFRLYERTFPPGERESLAGFRSWLGCTGFHEPAPYNFMMVMERGSAILGMATMHYVEKLPAAFLGYLAVVPELRGKGLGTSLAERVFREMARIHRRIGRGRFLGIFTELEHLCGQGEARRRRLAFWARLGMRPLHVAWRYPRISRSAKPSRMYLAFRSLAPGRPPFSQDDMCRIVSVLYRRIYHRDASDADLQQVLRSIRKGPGSVGYRAFPE